MTFVPVRQLAVWFEPTVETRRRVGRLAVQNREVLFEYDRGFLESGLQLSPFKLPLRPGVDIAPRDPFDGLFGVFDDSLPDGWGRLLIDRRAQKAGLLASQLGPLDRLSLVGARSMGALVYEPEVELEAPTVVKLPELEADAEAVSRGATAVDLDRLIALGGSPQGARPKVLVQLGPHGELLSGARDVRSGFTPYLVKLRARGDAAHQGPLEHAYFLMAAAAGLDVPVTTMLGSTKKHPGYLALERFDRHGAAKFHLHSLAGLLHVSHRLPTLTYRDLLVATRELTANEADVTEMFRRACFNVFAHNRDDHARNFAFLMSAKGVWRCSPAYDLTFSEGPGGEHTMLIGDGLNPGASDLMALAARVGVRKPEPIIDEVRAAVSRFADYADKARVPKRAVATVQKRLRAIAR